MSADQPARTPSGGVIHDKTEHRPHHLLRSCERLIGESASFRAAVGRIPALARGDATVLVTGETGTGKELVARAIHAHSLRATQPFIAVNCGSLAESLMEDELFGHHKGAFTDARVSRPGLVVEAHRGTLFLDEVDSLSARAQVALLRVLQDRTVRALGADSSRTVDVRFIAATNSSLAEAVRAGRFRADLYYRLHVLTLTLPPLRERRDDVLRIARHLLQRYALPGQPLPRLTPAAEAALVMHDWPGNVRELENAIIRGVHMCTDGEVHARDLGLEAPPVHPIVTLRGDAPAPPDTDWIGMPEASVATVPFVWPAADRSFQEQKRQLIAAFERQYLRRLIAQHGGNVSQAARTAGKERREFGKLLKKHDIDPRDFVGQTS